MDDLLKSALLKSALVIDEITGCCPVQASGTVRGFPFYFRSRGDRWRFAIATGNTDPVDVMLQHGNGFFREGRYGPEGEFAAGYMPHEEAREIIERCSIEFVVATSI